MESSSAEYPPTVNAPHDSRVLLREFLEAHGADDLAYAGELVMSELVSNVVRHAHSDVTVDLTWYDDTLRVEVRDGSSILPAVADLGDEDGGYGLRIIEAFADDWGIRPLTEGKAVWASVRRGTGAIPA